MTKTSEPNSYKLLGTPLSSLREIDADRPPMPTGGVNAITRICNDAAASMSAAACARPAGLGLLVAGNNAVLPPVARRINDINGAALAAGAVGLALAATSSKQTNKPAPGKSNPAAPTPSTPAPTAPTNPTPPTNGGKAQPPAPPPQAPATQPPANPPPTGQPPALIGSNGGVIDYVDPKKL